MVVLDPPRTYVIKNQTNIWVSSNHMYQFSAMTFPWPYNSLSGNHHRQSQLYLHEFTSSYDVFVPNSYHIDSSSFLEKLIFPLSHPIKMRKLFIRVVVYVSKILKSNKYRQTFHKRSTLVDNKIVDRSGVVGTLPAGSAPTTSLFST